MVPRILSWETKALTSPYQKERAKRGDGEADSEVLVVLPGSLEGGLMGDVKQWKKDQAEIGETCGRLKFLIPLSSSLLYFSHTEGKPWTG